MSVEQVSAIISRHRTPAIETERTDTRISVWTDAGLWDAIHLRIDFSDDKLAAARIRNADANARIKRAPSDIPENKESSNKGLVRTGDPRPARPSAQP